MTQDPSVTTIIVGLIQGDSAAAEQLWNRYFDKLVAAARRRLGDAPKRAYDEEDVALSVFHSLCRGAERGHFKQLTDRDDLWALLLTMTKMKAIDCIRHETAQKRGGGKVRGESAFMNVNDGNVVIGIEQFISDELTPELLTELQDQHQRLLGLLTDDMMRQIALMRMEGYGVSDIAGTFGRTTRWAERKLELIRGIWLRELNV